MNIPLTVKIHQDGDWFTAQCQQMPEVNGQGRTQEECIDNLKQAIIFLIQDQTGKAPRRSEIMLEIS